jgi:signal transduction histidine kinase
MYLNKKIRLLNTLAFRLTIWYTGIFTISSFFAFLLFYLFTANTIHRRADEKLLNEMSEYSSLLALEGIDTLRTALDLEAVSEGVEKVFFRIVGANGTEIASTDMSSWRDLRVSKEALSRLTYGTPHVFETMVSPQHGYETRILYGTMEPGKILQIGMSLKEDEQSLGVFRKAFFTKFAVLMAFAALIGWFVSKRALRGVEEVTRTALQVSKGAFKERVQVKAKGDEIHRLTTVFNGMLDRIDTLVTGVREMTDNIAHDLRSPITRIRGIAEMTLTTGKSVDEYQTMAADTMEECDRILRIVNTMLDISEAEAGAGKLTMERIDMAKIVQDACELFQATAEDKDLTIISRVSDGSFLKGDIQMLQRMVVNLLDNALKFAPSGGTITVSVNNDQRQIFISINDTGILALAIARAHGGDINATSSPGKGSEFIVTLPR